MTLVPVLAVVSVFLQGEAVDPCPAASLRCFDLVPVPALRATVSASAELRRVPSPFGVRVTQDGHHVYELILTVRGLPASSAPGDSQHVAWLTTPLLEPMTSLGPVRNGPNALGLVSHNKFLLLVTRERRSTLEATREGPLVLRGLSPSNLMLPLDASDLPAGGENEAHGHGAADGWRMPPMHPDVLPMPRGLERLRPDASPYLPQARSSGSPPAARPRQVMNLRTGDSLILEAGLVSRTIAGRSLVAYGFNGQYPGPLIRVTQNATIVVRFRNRLDQPSSVHWHGIRLDNRSDGVPEVTQDAVAPGGEFRYVIRFPDAGVYWYHPHVREDIQQDLGLYGNLFVQPGAPDHFGPVHHEEFLMLDDLLLADSAKGMDGPLVPYGRERATHALMGRFGNVLLVNGEPRYRLRVNRGAVVRFYITNASNTRPFNVSFEGAELKVIGSDVGLFEREERVESVPIAPAERYIVEARFPRAGAVAFVNRVQALDRMAGAFFADVDTLGEVHVADEPAEPDYMGRFLQLARRPEVTRELLAVRQQARHGPRRDLLLTLETASLPFGLVQALRLDTGYVHPVEWSGTMPMMDWLSTAGAVRWILRDPTGRENMDIAWRFRVGDLVRLRFRNDRHTLHPMAHPIHIHGQRFLVLAVDGVANDNLVWKDTFLLPASSTADILLELSNPGRWMLHCHIAEHLEAGMHMVFTVSP